ncbi:RIP metalloprotease RseP [Neisseria chenwenguii]|uniref:Zinc metalloprotease n=1 Tax=Neisseria chenwenguii TaxID=1853278 RepID=A0A220S1D8_9NEIS|nr:RIP metalloprotease RseP [Neisseria chenwenguii]ASK27223.1 RIP metalloprotease RseP [Neisseria chenwenguii]ROV54832.1 RIP metalloprotease RseP [Neisseria chenwenguii]
MQTFIAFIVAILILVSLHEFGHYIVARWCGVKVLRFSVGFGKPFFTKKRGDTEWCFSPIPLGGYVKMVDTREGNVSKADLPYAFDKQHPAKRIAIVAAGPLTNLVLAVLLYGLSFSFGVTEIKPFVGTVEPSSIAAKAGFQSGDKILSVNGEAVKDWPAAQTEMVLALEAGKVNVAVQTASGEAAVRIIDAAGTPEAGKIAQNKGNIGLVPFKITNRLELVEKGSPAKAAGLKAGDTLLAANGKALKDWMEWANLFRKSPGQKIDIVYERGGKTFTAGLRPDTKELSDGTLIGRAGLAPQTDEAWDKQIRREYTPSVPEAFKMGWDKTVGYSTMTLKFFGKLVTGQASLSHVSGPLTIADIAGKSAEHGVQSYLEFLALVSISLGVLNLLPIPVLDGGHLVYYTAEWIRGKPLSERIQAVGLRFGLAAMLMLMLVAFFNDINCLFG